MTGGEKAIHVRKGDSETFMPRGERDDDDRFSPLIDSNSYCDEDPVR